MLETLENAISEKSFCETRPRPRVRQPISSIRKIFPSVLEENEKSNRVGSIRGEGSPKMLIGKFSK
jgi:hypothetical protein